MFSEKTSAESTREDILQEKLLKDICFGSLESLARNMHVFSPHLQRMRDDEERSQQQRLLHEFLGNKRVKERSGLEEEMHYLSLIESRFRFN